MSELIPMDEVCEYFDCKEPRVVAMLRSGELPGLKIGHAWRIPREAFWQRVNELALEEAERRRQEEVQPVHWTSNPGEVPRRPRGRPRKY